MTTGLTLAAVSVSRGHRTIVDDASVSFEAGTVTSVIGPNGAGKSTLLGIAAGTVRPTSGTARLGGHDLRRLSVKHAARRRAVMPQDATVAFAFTVREVVAMGRIPWRDLKSDVDRVVSDALATTGLTHLQDREVTTLSGGERQLTAFARVVAQATPVTEESVILLDEPTAAMDIAHAEATLALVRALARRGAAVGLVLHDIDAAAAYADRVVLLQHGRVRASGPVPEVCASATLSDVYGTPIEVFDRDGRLHVGPVRRDPVCTGS
ncbi:heme ABC transporter ATP-binding protein [Flexivirga caeni]|uniref:Heme ABC transporter ATP-binding protein n=1 Tax=Flexivirga caeni TaxID=2294115 RepID=A0A3M9M423_9MICO|nr:heme ABC transporter ATP-binding protein [Flexivirga caeni]RNI20329.1 heme ABC transporter ATP-binding protein [Flexivirga caeni]